MKTTIEIDDHLFERARQEAKRQGITLKTLFHRALQASLAPKPRRAESFALDFPVVHDERACAVDVADRKALYDYMEER